MKNKATAVESLSETDPFENSPIISAALYFMASGDYLFRWKDGTRINQKCLAAPDVTAAFSGTEVDSGWMPAGILRHGYGARGPWAALEIPPTRQQITMIQPDGKEKMISVVFPRLLMIGLDKTYYLTALDSPFKPNGKVYMAPFTNIYSDHRICWGSNMPMTAGAETMQKAWRLFIELPFNGDLANGKSVAHTHDIRTAWRKYSKAEEWPVNDLVVLRVTADQLIRNIIGGESVH